MIQVKKSSDKQKPLQADSAEMICFDPGGVFILPARDYYTCDRVFCQINAVPGDWNSLEIYLAISLHL